MPVSFLSSFFIFFSYSFLCSVFFALLLFSFILFFFFFKQNTAYDLRLSLVCSEMCIRVWFHRTDSLSGGQQQRVAIARAIFQNASYLLADEPVSAVDPTRAHSLLERLTSIATDHKLTLVCTLHNLEYAKKFFPRLIGMRSGAVSYDGSAQDFTENDFNELYSLDYSKNTNLTP